MAVLVFLLLAPMGFGLLLQARGEQSDCGMECCKRTKVCCCRKADRIARKSRPGWVASAACSTGCRQLPALAGGMAAGLAAGRIEVRLLETTVAVRVLRSLAPRALETDFALFERPPPAV